LDVKMMFPHRIKSILPSDRVLEIGPGGTPHPRADVLLEKVFPSEEEARQQRGLAAKGQTDQLLVTYDGETVPFAEREFDYVICSHVLEHVHDVDSFTREISRVGKKGYIEYPTIYYEYLYNFRVHRNFLLLRGDVIHWMPKGETPLNEFREVQRFFYDSLAGGYNDLAVALQPFLFEGREWFDSIKTRRVTEIKDVCFEAGAYRIPKKPEIVKRKKGIRRLFGLRGI